MSKPVKPFKTYRNTFPVGKSHVECLVCIHAEPEDMPFEDLTRYMDAKVIETLSRDLESGAVTPMNVTVEVSIEGIDGVKGIDSIGGVWVYRPEDVDQCVVDHAMEFNAHEDLKKNIEEVYLRLKTIKETENE